MNQSINLKITTLAVRNSISPAIAGHGLLFVALALAWLPLSPTARAVSPAPDGGYPNGNTAEGDGALASLTTGGGNTAVGRDALFSNTTSSHNTAAGFQALYHNATPDFGFPGDNTANGYQALYSNTTGIANTAAGFQALFHNTTGRENTATGGYALLSNTTGSLNTATGVSALSSNTLGFSNTATGVAALLQNTRGHANTATGLYALADNTVGNSNTATGADALGHPIGNNNTATGAAALYGCIGDCFFPMGDNNTATGANALLANDSGNNNTASGFNALKFNGAGSNNTAEGVQALQNSTGSNNIALGANAGINLTTGNNNIDIAASGIAGESNTIRIGKRGVQTIAYMQGISGATVASGVTVIVDTKGHLGTVQSSARFKDEIKPMDKASEAILALKPVTFRYKKELDPEGIPQFGLVAEQVEKVNPDLVARDADGKVNTVRYEAVNAMLLNEFLKEHRTVQDLKKEVAALTVTVKEQASQIQKVTRLRRVELSKPVPQMIANNQ
jgi:hypothetical protein